MWLVDLVRDPQLHNLAFSLWAALWFGIYASAGFLTALFLCTASTKERQ